MMNRTSALRALLLLTASYACTASASAAPSLPERAIRLSWQMPVFSASTINPTSDTLSEDISSFTLGSALNGLGVSFVPRGGAEFGARIQLLSIYIGGSDLSTNDLEIFYDQNFSLLPSALTYAGVGIAHGALDGGGGDALHQYRGVLSAGLKSPVIDGGSFDLSVRFERGVSLYDLEEMTAETEYRQLMLCLGGSFWFDRPRADAAE